MAHSPPKLDLKMLVVPVILLLSRNVDMKNEKIVQLLQTVLISIGVVVLSIHYLVYLKVTSSKNDKKIWVPPKPKPQLPFGLGPPEEPLKVEDFEETTYPALEFKLLKESVGSIFMSLAISLVMSYKFNIHMSLMIQAAMLPMNMLDSPVVKKYVFALFGLGNPADRSYNEQDSAPTAQSLASAAAVSTTATETTEPRVVELPDEPKASTTTETDGVKRRSTAAAVRAADAPTTTKADELD